MLSSHLNKIFKKNKIKIKIKIKYFATRNREKVLGCVNNRQKTIRTLIMIIQITNIVDPDTRGSGYTWIRIQFAGSGSRREKTTHKSEEISSFEGLEVLF
jgi:hypothetical protein